MIDGKRIIGVCLTKIQDKFNSDFVSSLHSAALENNSRVIVFNSVHDLFNNDANDRGSKSIFDLINYNIIDMLVILSETFYDKETIKGIVAKAKDHHIPVIIIHGKVEGCYCIENEYKNSFKELIRHVIVHHNAKDSFFITGTKGDEESERRIECFKEVLEEEGLEFSYDNVGYGGWWRGPTVPIVKNLIESGKLPRAIICANDYMAMAACSELMEDGYRVPEDVIVTGFDGVQNIKYFSPHITTCAEDFDALGRLTIEIGVKAINGEIKPGVFSDASKSIYSESCGCNATVYDIRKEESFIYKMMQDSDEHELFVYKWLDRILESRDLNRLSQSLSGYILGNSFVCLKHDFIALSLGYQHVKTIDEDADDLVVIASRSNSEKKINDRFSASDMVPQLYDWVNDDTMFVVSSIFVGDEVCGYYAVKSRNINLKSKKINRIIRMMNVAFNAVMSQFRQINMKNNIENAAFTDQITGLPNLKGATQWFNDFSALSESHNQTLAVSIYSIPKFKYIYENYGMQDVEEVLHFVAESLKLSNSSNSYIAHTSDDEFCIINYLDNPNDVAGVINHTTSVFYGLIEGFNHSDNRNYYIEVNCGCSVASPGWNESLATYIKLASNEMYLNRLSSGGGTVLKESTPPKELYSAFNLLVEKNLFNYNFQPIVDAKTGEIYAYEALMRTKGGINMSPLDILSTAKEYNKLYEIEKATFFNVAEKISSEKESFGGRKIFINSIPGCFLTKEDHELFFEKYGSCYDDLVIELTEQDTVSDEELNSIKFLHPSDGRKNLIAIDDYGTGHSNIVNLLRYSPQIIKVDRFLISSINTDTNKQMFVKSTIEFARMNNIKVLAEGVETFDELKTVIELGVDYIQGYYTARPAETPLTELPEKIRNEIAISNLSAAGFNSGEIVYTAKPDETINLNELADKFYTSIIIPDGNVCIVGDKTRTTDINVKISDNIKCSLTLEDVIMRSHTDGTIQLGKGSVAKIHFKGENTLMKEGIHVPEGAELELTGEGMLNIEANRNYGSAIGTNCNDKFGKITIDCEGTIKILSVGDYVSAIGGLSSSDTIHIKSGKIITRSGGMSAVGIGSVNGSTKIITEKKADIEITSNGNNAVSIGAIKGRAELDISGAVHVISNGEKSVGIGCISSENCSIRLNSGYIISEIHTDVGICFGSLNGKATVISDADYVEALCEGNSTTGIGSGNDNACFTMNGGTINIRTSSGEYKPIGCSKGKTIVDSGNIVVTGDIAIEAKNSFGVPLVQKISDEVFFEKEIVHESGSYTYKASKNTMIEKLCMYLPKEYAD